MSENKEPIHSRISSVEFGHILLEASKQKDELQARLSQGTTVTTLSQEFLCSISTMRKVLDCLKIVHGRKLFKAPQGNPGDLQEAVELLSDRVSRLESIIRGLTQKPE